ncbi:MAG: FtsQ-type POTRA domain-containing protein [Hyphomicrobium sp.]|nr:FtsQ-type POTRA domain-containing protein [Hyphomicrobium sp.]
MQQVGGATEIGQRVPQAPSLDPNATLFSALDSPVSAEADIPFAPGQTLPRRRRAERKAAFGRRLGLALFMGLSGALAFSLLTDGGRQTRAVATFLPDMEQVLSWMGLRIEQVALSGQRFTADADVFAALDLVTSGSLVTFDAAEARARIESLPWVSSATINRIYPGSLEVRISERQPSALWINDGREFLVDGSGRVLSGLKAGTKVKLPRLSGAGAPEQAQALLELIVRFPRIAERFEMAERVGGRRWTLHLKDGVVVHLGGDREAVAFAALSSPEELGKLLEAKHVIVDLRTRGRITVRAAPQSASAIPTQS